MGCGAVLCPVRAHRQGMDDDSSFDGDPFSVWPGGEDRRSDHALTLALLEDLAAVLQAHGFPPLRGYVLVELTSSLYRLLM